ncbi:MAG: NYN domain-containing protein [Limisphaerales bacterium]
MEPGFRAPVEAVRHSNTLRFWIIFESEPLSRGLLREPLLVILYGPGRRICGRWVLLCPGSCLLTGKKTQRGEIRVDLDKALDALEEFACRISKLPLLRIYWYDGTSTGPTPQHVALAFKPRVKVRLGFVNTAGQQKGVDSLIVTDMITLARNRVMCDAVLLSGDEDIRVGVQQAQEFGVRVHLLGIAPCRGSRSLFLLQEADTTHEWGKKDISAFLSHNQMPLQTAPLTIPTLPPSLAVNPAPASPGTLDDLAMEAANEVDTNLIEGVIKNYDSTGQLPPLIDRPLLGRAGSSLGRLDPTQLRDLRKSFVAAMRRRLRSK